LQERQEDERKAAIDDLHKKAKEERSEVSGLTEVLRNLDRKHEKRRWKKRIGCMGIERRAEGPTGSGRVEAREQSCSADLPKAIADLQQRLNELRAEIGRLKERTAHAAVRPH
jgi:hypothetical protein